jgi:hypothetical protein
MREQKELPSFPKECGHQNTQPNMTKQPPLPYSIPGIQLLVLKFESLDGKLLEKCVGRWTLNGIPLPVRNF